MATQIYAVKEVSTLPSLTHWPQWYILFITGNSKESTGEQWEGEGKVVEPATGVEEGAQSEADSCGQWEKRNQVIKMAAFRILLCDPWILRHLPYLWKKIEIWGGCFYFILG